MPSPTRTSNPHQASRALALAAAAVAALVLTGVAQAKSFDLPQANVAIQVAKDGSLVVDEDITYAFNGSFRGGYRDIPLRSGESIEYSSRAMCRPRHEPDALPFAALCGSLRPLR